ncbi:MAG: heme biosynthesis HemY N-terminal domain-containing protein [Porticoccaceae bacterium]
MRKVIVLIALALVVGGLLFWSMGYAQGFIMISVGNEVVQLSLWMAVVVLLALWCVLRLVGWIFRSITRPGVQLWKNRKQGRAEKSRRQVLQGLESYYEGRWRDAKQGLMKSAPSSDAPALNYLVAAEAAAEMGNDQEAEEILTVAEKEIGGDSIALYLARARVLMRGRDYGRAAAVLRDVQQRQPKHPYALRLLKDALVQQQDWENLEKLLPDLRRTKAEPKDALDALEISTRRGVLDNFLQVDSVEQPLAQRLESLSQLWSNTPKAVRRNAELVTLYSKALENVGEHKNAETQLRQQINREWSGALVLNWVELETPVLPKKLTIAEAWLRSHQDSPELLLALGLICRRSELWGKAKDYLERAVKVGGSPQAYGELAAVMEQLGERSKSDEYYQAGLKSSLSLI